MLNYDLKEMPLDEFAAFIRNDPSIVAWVSEDGEPLLFDFRDDLPRLEILLECGADPNVRNKDGDTLLHKASFSNEAENVAILLRFGANTSLLDHDGLTALFWAIDTGRSEVERLLREAWAADDIWCAAAAGNLQLFEEFVREQPSLLDVVGGNGSVLHVAAYHGFLPIVRFSIEHGASIHAKNKANRTPLHVAAMYCQEDICRFLLAHGASINELDLTKCTPLGLTPATCTGTFETLLSLGARLDVFSAARLRDPTRLRSLLDSGEASVDDREPSSEETPLHVAAAYNNVEAVQLLLERGADPNAKAHFDFTPLSTAVASGNLAACSALLAHQANPNQSSALSGCLATAIDHQDAAILQELLDHGADPNHREDLLGAFSPPLQFAIHNGWKSGVEALLAAGADPLARDIANQTAYHVAIQVGSVEMLELLLIRPHLPLGKRLVRELRAQSREDESSAEIMAILKRLQ